MDFIKIIKNNFRNISALLLPLSIISLSLGSSIINIVFSISLIFILLLFFVKKELIDYFPYNKHLIILICIFILISILASFKNYNENYFYSSLARSITNLRFFLLGLVFFVFLKTFKNFLITNYLLLFFLIFLSLDIIFQYFNGTDFFNLPRWSDRGAGLLAINGEYRAGSLIFKSLIPSVFFIFFYKKFKFKTLFFIVVLITVFFAIVLTGERVTILNYIVFIFLFLLIKSKIQNSYRYFFIGFIFFFVTLIFSSIFILNDDAYKSRIINLTKSDFFEYNSFNESRYFQKFYTGIEIFKQNIFIGSGPKTFRYECKNFSIYKLGCSTHPHNFYIEILSEYGLLGIVLLIFIFITIFKISKFKLTNFKDMYFLSLFLVFILSINPLTITGSFFSSWNAYSFWTNLYIMSCYSIFLNKYNNYEKNF